MADRRVKVVFEAEISKYKQGMADAAKETEKLAKSADEAGDSTKQRMADIEKVAAADQRAAKAAGLLYNAQGQLADSNGKVLNSAQAAAHNLDSFSEAAYLAGMESEEAAAKSAAAAAKTTAAWESVAVPMMAVGVGLVAGVGATVKAAADFDKGMSGVAAATHESSANMALLRQEAIRAGADTAYSATEAAGAITELSKAGVSTTDVLNGGLDGALALAAAGELDVATAAEFAASAMTQFQLSGKDIPHIADLLAAGAGKAQGSVNDMGLALSYAGVPAKAMGASIEETTGAIALFASNGIIGEKAGTALRSMFVSMANPTNKTAKLMDELGISFEDGNGKFIGLAASAQVLQDALADESEMARNAALAQIFGNEALGAAQALYAGGAAKVQEWTDAVNDSGYAAETASIMQDNLAGDLEKLGGAFDTVFIQAGGTGNDVLRGFVQTAESFVDVIGQIPAPVLGVGTVIAGIGGGAMLAVGGVATLVPKVIETYEAFNTLRTSGSKSVGVMKDIGKVAGIAAVAVGTLAVASQLAGTGLDDIGSQSQFGDAIKKSTKDVDAAREALNEFSSAAGSGGAGISGIGQALEVLNMNGVMRAMDWVGSVGGIFDSDLKLAEESVTRFDDALSTLATSGDFDSAASGFRIAAEEGAAAGLSVQQVADKFPGYMDALRNAANGAASEQEILNWALNGTEPAGVAAAGAAQETADALADVGVSASGAVDSMADFLDLLFQTGMITMNSRDAAAAYEEQLDSVQEAAEEIAKGKLGKALNKAKDDFDLSTEAGRLANQEFQALAKGGMDEVRAMSEEGLGQDQLQEKLSTTYKDLVKSGEAFGLSKSAAQDLAREVLGVPDGVSIESWMSEVAKTTAEETTKSIAEIPGYTEVTVAVTEDGTTGEVQSKINGVTGKTEFVFVTEDGTTQVVQEAIVSIDGVTRKVWVTDDGTVVGTQADINGIKGKNATVTVGASGIDTVERQLNWVARPRASSISIKQSITKEITSIDNGTSTGQFGKKKAGGRLPQHADGGRLPRTGLGTDKILGIASDGTPLSWVDDLEWVINRRSSDKHDELLGMINRDDPRVDMMKQLVGLKSGGRVGEAERKVERLQRQYSRMPGDKKNRARKLDLKDELDAAKKELKAVKASTKASEKAAKEAKKKAEEARKAEREKQQRLSEARFDLSRDLKRGDITDAFTSGSGMSIVDRLFDQSKNKDLSKKQRSRLRSLAYKTESELLKLEKQSDKLATSLEKAKDKRDELLAAKDSAASSVRSGFSLQDSLDEVTASSFKKPNAKSLLTSVQARAGQMKDFGGKIEKLRKKGYSAAIIEEVVSYGIDGGTELADILLSATSTEKNAFNSAYKSMDKYAEDAGESLTKAMHKGGVDSAEGVVAGLESKKKKVEGAFYQLGKDAEKAFRSSLDMHSPSRTLAGSGRDAMDGILVGHDERRQAVIDAFASTGDDIALAFQPSLTSAVPASVGAARYAQAAGPKTVEHHYHIDAKPGLAHQYAQDIANQTSTKVGDFMAAYGE